ncbi:MAG: hypothetical protein ISS47_03295 [Candidatus Omnitrophica bacterium]|nr:hypothetical protein [Candidatus Omnitrophota bacterium]
MQKKIFLILAILLSSVLCGFLYQNLVFNFQKTLITNEQIIPVYDTKVVSLNYDLPYEETLFLKIKAPAKFPISQISFNENILKPERIRKRGLTHTYYLFIPLELVKKRSNLKIRFYIVPNLNIDVRLYNYRNRTTDSVVIFLKDSHIFKSKKVNLSFFIVASIFLFIWWLIKKGLEKILVKREAKVYQYGFFILLPANIFLSLFALVPSILGLRIALTCTYFITTQIIFAILACGFITLLLLKQWFRQREFSDKCLLLFMILLIMCAFLLMLHLGPIAEQLANIAYFILVLGVGIKCVKMAR